MKRLMRLLACSSWHLFPTYMSNLIWMFIVEVCMWWLGNTCVFPDTQSVIYSATREGNTVTINPCR